MFKNQWHMKEFSQLTKVSIRTLRHYDTIGLLKASLRLANGYRVYSETDLARLQQILTLKSFGFELSQIKDILSGSCNMIAILQMQKIFLVEKMQQFKVAIDILTSVIDESQMTGSVDTASTLKLIGVYKMTKELEASWANKIFTKEQLKKWAALPQLTEAESKQYDKDWETLIAETAQHTTEDPFGKTGQLVRRTWR